MVGRVGILRPQLALIRASALCLCIIACFCSDIAYAQNFQTGNQYVVGDVQPSNGKVCILIPPGRVNNSAQLNFYDKCYFSVAIKGQIYSNNSILSSPPPGYNVLNDGLTSKIADTVRTVWSNRNGVDIIQDVYPVKYERSGQIVLRWSIKNNTNTPAGASCQWLNDVQITDPNDHSHRGQPNSTDGPKILHRYGYHLKWEQIPNTTTGGNEPLPWFYLAFLWGLPDLNPGLSGQGYLDFPPAVYKKPIRMTIGDWYTLTQTAFGSNPGWPIGSALTEDDAVLLEWSAISINGKETTVIGITSYGTGEFEICNGNIFGILFYPHRIHWQKGLQQYIPNPFNLEFYAFDPDQHEFSFNTSFTLAAGPHLTVVDTPPPYIPIGKTQRLPRNNGVVTIVPGGVQVFDWYLLADPVYFCQGDFHSTLTLTGTTSLGIPTFVDPTGNGDYCEHGVIIECAELDVDPPIYSNAVDQTNDGVFIDTIRVHDDRTTDRGLKSFKAIADSRTDSTMFVIGLETPIKPCFNDKDIHKIIIRQLDSTIGGCFTFTFEDCIGNTSSEVYCMPPHPKYIVPDTLKPLYAILERHGGYDTVMCNIRLDSLEALDDRPYDKGIDSVYVLSGDGNMELHITPFQKGIRYKQFSVSVRDSMLDGNICIRAVDGAKNYSDTCFYYCTIPDKLAPRLTVFADGSVVGLWHVIVKDDTTWDRTIDQIFISNSNNVTFPPNGLVPPTRIATQHQREFYFDVKIIDTSKVCGFCVKANDLAGNVSDTVCIYRGVGTDIFPPNIFFTPDPITNLTSISVDINDVHFNDPPTNLDTVIWDLGLDSVWFTNNTGIITPATIYYNCSTHTKTAPSFILTVADSLSVDSVACVTVNVVDCNGNFWQREWCYRYKPDVMAPQIVAEYLDKQQIKVTITDSTTYDRGLQTIGTLNEQNLSSYIVAANRKPVTSFILQRPQIGQSSSGTVSAIDYWGTLSTARIPLHSASVDLRVWIQDLAMQKGKQIHQSQNFEIPVYFVSNDTFPLLQKKISDFKFSFTMRGDINSVRFLGVSTIATATASGWNVTGTPSGSTITIEGHKFSATPYLSARAPLDSLVLLQFAASKDESTRSIILEIDQTLGETVIYNNGIDTIYRGLSSIATMPPPWGSLSGSAIVIVGSCAPSLVSKAGTQQNITIDEPTPNPIAKQTTLHYTVSNENRVQISVYDMLGREVKQMLDQTQKQGYYGISLDVSDLLNGTYVVRLESSGTIVSRMISVQK